RGKGEEGRGKEDFQAFKRGKGEEGRGKEDFQAFKVLFLLFARQDKYYKVSTKLKNIGLKYYLYVILNS
ncbi:hypothetical protein VF12_21610, partial [Nostoc linckia z15]